MRVFVLEEILAVTIVIVVEVVVVVVIYIQLNVYEQRWKRYFKFFLSIITTVYTY